MNQTKIETIKALIASKNKVFAYSRKTISDYSNNANNLSLKEDLKILENETFRFSDLFEFANEVSRENLAKYFETVNFSDDELNIKVSYDVIMRFYPTSYITEEKYLSTMITPICYRPNFQRKNITQKLLV